MSSFFVPGVEPDRAEARYAELATFAGVEVPPVDRVRSVRFPQGAEEWTATVGEPLVGRLAARTERRPARRSSSSRSAPTRDVTDPAVVQAILPTDDGFVVVTDALPVGPVADSTWDNPFRVPGHAAQDVRRFSPAW